MEELPRAPPGDVEHPRENRLSHARKRVPHSRLLCEKWEPRLSKVRILTLISGAGTLARQPLTLPWPAQPHPAVTRTAAPGFRSLPSSIAESLTRW